jgi:hypothetical protein
MGLPLRNWQTDSLIPIAVLRQVSCQMKRNERLRMHTQILERPSIYFSLLVCNQTTRNIVQSPRILFEIPERKKYGGSG